MLYESYKDKVYSIALYHFHGDAAIAADVTQQVFVKAITNIGNFRGDAGIGTWLYRLTANECLDRRRAGAAREIATSPETFVQFADTRSPERDAGAAEESSRVRTAVSSLPERLRLPILMRYFEDMSYEELAHALDCSTGTVASRLNRGHQLLREKLAKWVTR